MEAYETLFLPVFSTDRCCTDSSSQLYIVNDGVILAIALAKSFEPVASLDILFSLFKERALSDDQKLNNSFDGLLYFCLQVEFDNVYYVKC